MTQKRNTNIVKGLFYSGKYTQLIQLVKYIDSTFQDSFYAIIFSIYKELPPCFE